MKTLLVSLAVVGCISHSHAAENKTVKVTVAIRGTASDGDAKALQATLNSLKGVRVKADAVKSGERGRFRHYFSPPFVIELTDVESMDVGGVAEAISKTKTPSRSEITPSLNLVLYSPKQQLGEEDIMALRTAVTDVTGLEPFAAGGIGAVIKDSRFWVRLEAAGGAQLRFIEKALKEAGFDYKLLKP